MVLYPVSDRDGMFLRSLFLHRRPVMAMDRGDGIILLPVQQPVWLRVRVFFMSQHRVAQHVMQAIPVIIMVITVQELSISFSAGISPFKAFRRLRTEII